METAADGSVVDRVGAPLVPGLGEDDDYVQLGMAKLMAKLKLVVAWTPFSAAPRRPLVFPPPKSVLTISALTAPPCNTKPRTPS